MSHPYDCDSGMCPDCQREAFSDERERVAEREREEYELGKQQRLDTIGSLRKISGAGIMDCRDALDRHGWELEKATMHLRTLGLAIAFKSKRVTPCGSQTCPADGCPYAHSPGQPCHYCGWFSALEFSGSDPSLLATGSDLP